MLGPCEVLIFRGELGPVKEVGERAFVQHSVDYDMVFGDFEVEAPVVGAEAVERLSFPDDFAKSIPVQILQVFVGDLEVVKNLELFQRAKLRNFRR